MMENQSGQGQGVCLIVGADSLPHHTRSPYVVVELVSAQQRRQVVKTKKSRVSNYPKWNQSTEFTFDPQLLASSQFICTVWSSGHRFIGAKDRIGTVAIDDLQSFINQDLQVRSYPLDLSQKSGKIAVKKRNDRTPTIQLSFGLTTMTKRTVAFVSTPGSDKMAAEKNETNANRIQTIYLIEKIQEQLKKDHHLEDDTRDDSSGSSSELTSEAATCSLEEDYDLISDMVVEAGAHELSAKELTFVKDGWIKVLAFGNRMFFEAFSERWYALSRNTVSILGVETEDMITFLYGWVDLAVHSYTPETEIIFRESFRPFHSQTGKLYRFSTIERYANHLVTMGIPPASMLALDEAWYFALTTHTPYFLDVDREALTSRQANHLVVMFRHKILASYITSLELQTRLPHQMTPLYHLYKENVPPQKERELGLLFYKLLFDSNPELIDFFANVDLDHLSDHLVQTIRLFLESRNSLVSLVPAMKALGIIHQRAMIPSSAFPFVI